LGDLTYSIEISYFINFPFQHLHITLFHTWLIDCYYYVTVWLIFKFHYVYAFITYTLLMYDRCFPNFSFKGTNII